MKKVIGLGNSLVDMMVPLANEDLLNAFGFPKGSMTLINDDQLIEITKAIEGMPVTVAAGGSAANTINGLANTGVETAFIGKIGQDEIGDIFKKDMESNGITPLLAQSSTPSGRAIALVTPDGERTFATYLGASIELTEQDVEASPLDEYDIMYIEGYLVQNEELIRKGVKEAKEKGLKVALDLASFNVVESNLELLQDLMNDVDYIFANEEEARAYCNQEPEAAVETLGKSCEVAIVKIGAQGSLVRINEITEHIEAIPSKPVDTTGAGDMFAAGFLYGQVAGLSTQSSGKAGSLLAGKVIENLGAKINNDTWKEIKKELLSY